jgi:hypothetical protein
VRGAGGDLGSSAASPHPPTLPAIPRYRSVESVRASRLPALGRDATLFLCD